MIRYRSESDYMNAARKYTNAISAPLDPARGCFEELKIKCMRLGRGAAATARQAGSIEAYSKAMTKALIGLVFPLHQIHRVYGFYREEKPPLSAALRLLALSIRIGSIQRWSTVMALTH